LDLKPQDDDGTNFERNWGANGFEKKTDLKDFIREQQTFEREERKTERT